VPRRGWWESLGLLVLALLGAGCIGTTDRSDFTAEIQERGGGLTSELPRDAVDAVAARLGVDDFEVRTITVTPPDGTVLLDVRDPAAPEHLDRYVVRRGAVDQVQPIRLTATDILDTQTFPVSRLALDRVEHMVDTALAQFPSDGYVTSMTIDRDSDEVEIDLALESARTAATARFSGDGELVEVIRS
jgi:hypothetical protein